MSTVRKKKIMIRKLNTYFQGQGKILSEREYRDATSVPFRLTMLKKYLGNWSNIVSAIQHYYPEWEFVKPEPVVEVAKTKFRKVLKNDE